MLDVAHNPAAGFALRGTLKQNPVVGKTFCVLGMLNDKQHMDFIGEIAPVVDTWFLTNPGEVEAGTLSRSKSLCCLRPWCFQRRS